jgi:hypothetical protein
MKNLYLLKDMNIEGWLFVKRNRPVEDGREDKRGLWGSEYDQSVLYNMWKCHNDTH